MQEKLLALWQNIEAQIRIVIFAVFGVLLLIIFALKGMEAPPAGDIGGPVGGGGSPAATPASIQVNDPFADRIQAEAYGERAPIEKSPYASLLANSMFDVKSVQDAVVLEEQANRRFDEATRLYNEKKYRESLEVCKEVLAIRSGHLRAQQLKATLEEKLRDAGVIRADSTPSQPSVAGQTPAAAAGTPAATPAIPAGIPVAR